MGQPWDVVPALGESATGGWGTPRLAATAELGGLDTLAFTEEVLPGSATSRRPVDTSGEIADYREAEEAPVVAISTKATDSRDWFDLGIVITLEGQPVSFAALFSALAAGQTRMLLPSGAYFSLDLPELHQLRALIDEARSLQDNKDARCRSAASRPDCGTSSHSSGSWMNRQRPGASPWAACPNGPTRSQRARRTKRPTRHGPADEYRRRQRSQRVADPRAVLYLVGLAGALLALSLRSGLRRRSRSPD